MSIDVPEPVQPPVDGALRLCVDNLSVLRGGRRVLDHLSFSLSAGQALIVTGPNGAGKSTLLRALAGLLPRAGGSIAFEGGPSDVDLPQQAHYLAHSDGLKSALSVEENLEFWSRYLAQEPDRRSRTVGAALDVVSLAHVAAAPFGVLSAGQKRRAALARLLVAFRPLWLLDEPLTALDRASRERFAVAMRDHCGHGGLIVAATHEPLGLDEAASLALGAAS